MTARPAARQRIQLDFWPELSHPGMVLYARTQAHPARARSGASREDAGRAAGAVRQEAVAVRTLPDGNHGENNGGRQA